ncbi:hypothetical protein [Streptomyces sp. IMTB 1903]|uniref:hypothetical protein n=1 Tax=Streptomyces sp. IMTB 1903 TaxID=1776680 RepID=UPI0007532839|nr:hypothetical protein [Streptomyces sp. IMTB 1903]
MTITETPPFRPEIGGTEADDVMCTACLWTYGIICPECAGCGCSTRCSGWRHAEYAQDDDPAEPGEPLCDDDCDGCDDCSPYGMAYGEAGW